jgi:hypothetical protein
VINLTLEAKQIPLKVEGLPSPATASIWLFDPEHKAEQMPDQSLSNDEMLTLLPQSMSLYITK